MTAAAASPAMEGEGADVASPLRCCEVSAAMRASSLAMTPRSTSTSAGARWTKTREATGVDATAVGRATE